MLALSFQVGSERYALPCRDVVEVVPLLRLRALPHAPAFVPGMFDYRGVGTPVIDLCLLLERRSCADKLSSRIMIVSWNGHTVGLLAERVTEAIDIDEKRVAPAGATLGSAPYLDRLVLAGDGTGAITQLIAIDKLVPMAVRALLGEGTP